VRKSIHTPQHKQLLALLREVRLKAGLTQAQLAERLNTDQTVISKIESGERRIDVLELRDICKAAGITLEAFVRNLEKSLKSD
jgi:transcriptional regulator with XRE-family HTH domain